jgi:hypothetical protein
MTGMTRFRSAPALLRWPTVAALVVAAAAHVPVTPEHLEEAPYMGYGFIAFTAAAMVAAVVVVVRRDVRAMVASGALCAVAIVVYALTRLVAFPQLADDVGNWTETLGLVSIMSEAVVVLLSAVAVTRGGAPERGINRSVCPDSALRA